MGGPDGLAQCHTLPLNPVPRHVDRTAGLGSACGARREAGRAEMPGNDATSVHATPERCVNGNLWRGWVLMGLAARI